MKGNSYNVRGGYKVIAFSEAPITSLARVLALASESTKMHYAPLGFMVDKTWLFEKGWRPVIYQSRNKFEHFPDAKKFLHVRYEPGNKTDYSWEREWRIRSDELKLDPNQTTLIVPTREWKSKYHEHHSNRGRMSGMASNGWLSAGPPVWHFISLSDLGITFKGLDPE